MYVAFAKKRKHTFPREPPFRIKHTNKYLKEINAPAKLENVLRQTRIHLIQAGKLIAVKRT